MPQSDKVQVTFKVETRSAAEVRAADLPEGSVVADERAVWLAARPPEGQKHPMERFIDGGRWLGIGVDADDGAAVDADAEDDEIDRLLANGAQVLRVGTGQED